MRFSRFAALVLSLVTALSLALPAQAAEGDGWLIPKVKDTPSFTDTVGSWCQSEVETVYESGLMEGQTAERFNPQGTLMPEHIVAVCARLYSLLTGGDGTVAPAQEGQAWYQPYYDYLAQALAYEGGADALMLNFHAGKYPAKRHAFVELLSLTLEAAKVELPGINAVTVLPDSTDPAVLAFYNAGILAGTDQYGTFDGNGILNRGQAAAMLARLVDPQQRQTFTLQSLDVCRDILGLDPYATALTVDGTAIRADVVAPTICTLLEERYHQMVSGGPDAGRLDTVLTEAADTMKEDLALERLAAERGISVTQEDLAKEYGAMVSGYRGLSEAAQRWENTHNLMKSRLSALYAQQYGSENWGSSPSDPAETPGSIRMESDLAAAKAAMTVTLSDSLSSLDLAAAQTRLVQSPLLHI